MQRFRLLPAVITISLASSAVLAHADNDTPAQAAARAALMQQMNQMDTEQAPGSSNSVTAPVAPSNSPPVEQAPPTAQEPPAAQESPAAQAPSAEQAPPVVQPPPAGVQAPSAAVQAQPAAPAIAQPTPQFSTNIPVVTTPETGPVMPETKGMPDTNVMPETSEPTMAEEKSLTNSTAANVLPPPSVLTNDAAQYPVNPPMAPLPPPQVEAPETTQMQTPAMIDQTHPVLVPGTDSGAAWPKPVPSNTSAQQSTPGMVTGQGASLSQEGQGTNSAGIQGFAPITAPPLPITPEKRSELQNLLSRYMANQITPVQYQEERARIMAEP